MNGPAVPGTCSAEAVRVERFASVGALPADADDLLDGSLFSSRAWWRCVEAAALPPGVEPLYLLARVGERTAGLLALARAADGTLGSLTTPYSCAFPILLAPGPAQARILRTLARAVRSGAVVRLDALDPAAAATSMLPAAAQRAGLLALHFDHFGNWREDVSGLDWPRYLAARPGALRETIRRRLRAAERQGDVTLRVIDGPAGLEHAIADYEAVYARSWKEAEPFPAFNPLLMRSLGPLGQLRLGVLDVAGQPVAVQFWVVAGGVASVLKLAHDEAFRRLSPGTVLTAMMIRHVLERDRPALLDFGRGDDGYKQGWVGHRRQMVGMLLVNPTRPSSWPLLGRHAGGRLAGMARKASGLAAAAMQRLPRYPARSEAATQRSASDTSVSDPASSQ